MFLQADSLLTEPPRKPKNTGVGSLSPLQWIFPTQELNLGLEGLRKIAVEIWLGMRVRDCWVQTVGVGWESLGASQWQGGITEAEHRDLAINTRWQRHWVQDRIRRTASFITWPWVNPFATPVLQCLMYKMNELDQKPLRPLLSLTSYNSWYLL